jgi:hypothetical protein
MIKHISGINNAKVLWREEGVSTFNETSMTLVADDNWTADISITTANIEYYILAEANTGKTLARPIVAPDGYWTIQVENLSMYDWAQNNISAPYPNPTQESVSFRLNAIEGPIYIYIHNILGQKLFETNVENGNGIIKLDLNSNWKGTLFVTFEGNFGKVNRKIIKY